MSDEVVLAREASAAAIVGAFVWLDSVRIVGLDVLLEVELPGECSRAEGALVLAHRARLGFLRAGSAAS